MSNIYLILFKNQLLIHKAYKIQTYDIPSSHVSSVDRHHQRVTPKIYILKPDEATVFVSIQIKMI